MTYLILLLSFLFISPSFAESIIINDLNSQKTKEDVFVRSLNEKEQNTFHNYINWITNNSYYKYENEPLPEIKEIPQDWMQIYAYGEETIIEYEKDGIDLPNIIALYDDKKNRIIIPHETNLFDYKNHHIIVHELVHFLQKINGHYKLPMNEHCPQRLETPAYELQLKWMDEVGHQGERPNALFVALIESGCYRR
jgi:hypothetical protein